MIWQLDLAVLVLVVAAAIGAVAIKDLLSCGILFGAYSFLMCALWSIMGAVDVAFTEASGGAGVSTVFFVRRFSGPPGGRRIEKVRSLHRYPYRGLPYLRHRGFSPVGGPRLSGQYPCLPPLY